MADGSSFPPSLVAALRRARTVFVLTGAGISAESGIATYRQRSATRNEYDNN